MSVGDFSSEEIALVISKYPKLARTSPGNLEGVLEMTAVYEDYPITDQFRVKITNVNPHSSRLPALCETSGRTEEIARKYGIRDTRDLHRNSDGTACVCVKQMERHKFPDGSSLIVFVEQLAVPYLYGLSYYDQHGRWPWKEYSHGGIGLLEFYSDDFPYQAREDIQGLAGAFRKELNWKEYHKQLRKPSAERSCLCRSGKPFHKCHNRAWRGLSRLLEEMNCLGIDPAKLFHR